LGYKTNLAEDLTLRLNVASGFRAKSCWINFKWSARRYQSIWSKQRFRNRAKRITNRFKFRIQSGSCWVLWNGFYNHINNYIYIIQREIIDENAVFDYIQDNAKLYGGEIGLHFHPHPLDWLHFETSLKP
jgi:iron complex outermembrane receptor protein